MNAPNSRPVARGWLRAESVHCMSALYSLGTDKALDVMKMIGNALREA